MDKTVEPLEQLTAILKTTPGLHLAGDAVLIQTLNRLLTMMQGVGHAIQAEPDKASNQIIDFMHQLRLSIFSLEKAIGEVDHSQNLKCATLDKQTLLNLTRALKSTLSALKTALGSPKEQLSPEIGTREQLAEDLRNREGKSTTAIQFSFDGLDKINLRQGREEGDRVLKHIASIIKNIVSEDAAIYQDGPGFVVLGDWTEQNQIESVSEQVTTKVSSSSDSNTLKVVIGVVLNETEDILEKTNLATAKSEGAPVFFNEKIQAENEERNQEHQLAIKILEEKRFYPEYQEIFARSHNLFSKQLRKFEVLWRSPDLTPFKFFGAMKEANRIGEVTGHMLPMIFQDIRGKNCEIAINITPEELGAKVEGMSFLRYMTQQSTSYGVELNRIIIELVEWSEHELLSTDSLKTLQKLKRIGCKLALDDYGVRSSNLVRLMQLCEFQIVPDYFKIDAALVKGLNRYLQDGGKSAQHRYSVIGIRSIIDLVKELRKETKSAIGIVAEFVDNQTLLKYLEKLGVTHFQGFFLAKPKPAKDIFH